VKTIRFSYTAASYIFFSLSVKNNNVLKLDSPPADIHEEALAFSVQRSIRTKHLLSFHEVSYREKYRFLQKGILDSLPIENLAGGTVSLPLPMRIPAKESTSFPYNGQSC